MSSESPMEGFKFYYANPDRPADKRRKPPELKNSFVVAEMWDRHKEIARRIALGQKNTEIALALGVTEQSISQVRNSPVVQEKTADLQAQMDGVAIDVGKRIRELAPLALKTLENILTDEEDTIPLSLKFKTATDLLDRAGHSAIRKVQGNVLHGHFTKDDLEEIKQLARDSGVVVDVEPVPES